MLTFRVNADPYHPRSLSREARRRRVARFEALTAGLPRPLTIIDLGGTPEFWEAHGFHERRDVRITLINPCPRVSRWPHIDSRFGDATDLSEYGDDAFDVAFSNSAIEHLFTLDAQRQMAEEMRRVAPRMFLQTPNYWFPVEPHFHVPGWQWLPRFARIALLRRVKCGWRGPLPDKAAAARSVDEVRLMSRRELIDLFPGATIEPERLAGLTKSWIVRDGFDEATAQERRIAA